MLLSALPLFPLGTVLFPGGVLPLKIFEVRYLDMIGQCIRTGSPFGVVALTQGSEVRRPDSAELFAKVGTLAVIENHSIPQPGLRIIRCKAAQRFRIQRFEQLKHGLWVGDVERLDDDVAMNVPDDLQPAVLAMQRLVDTLHARDIDSEDFPFDLPYAFNDCAWLSNRWCELLPLPTELKQRLMELDSPLMRLELVNDILAKQRVI